ncbi:sigma-E factor negative regulatory protein [Polaromonas hydrogenivorans]|uniref:Sigma-E factor negative regulatory protein n=1 Tax=Polaromonas hydrogenivorans TaxID=335476 RepID=A0AAU7LUF5_9BURK
MKSSMTTSELLSALADDQLGEEEFAAALDACGHDESALDCWAAYHLIGDVLRSPAGPRAPMAVGAELAFVSRLNKRLAQEPLITAPPVLNKTLPAAPLQPAAGRIHHRGPASNDGNFRWKLVAGVASLAAVSAIAWNASGLLAPASVPQMAQASSSQIVVTSSQGPVVRDARLEELLAAHRQFGAASALQESSGFLRNATFEMPREAQASGGR